MVKTRQDKIDKLTAQIAEQQNQLKQEKKKQNEEARKAKTKRQIARQGLLESALPEVVNLTDEQYKAFIARAVANDFGRKIVAGILAERGNGANENQK